jgi:hypothetical protein
MVLLILLKRGAEERVERTRIWHVSFYAVFHSKTGDISLAERRVPTVLSPRCACDSGNMTVHHILLICPTWTILRSRYLAELKTLDIRKILNSIKGSKAAVQFILATNLLPQFQRVACEEQETRRGND